MTNLSHYTCLISVFWGLILSHYFNYLQTIWWCGFNSGHLHHTTIYQLIEAVSILDKPHLYHLTRKTFIQIKDTSFLTKQRGRKKKEGKECCENVSHFRGFLSVVYWDSNLPQNGKSVKERGKEDWRFLENRDLGVDLPFWVMLE